MLDWISEHEAFLSLAVQATTAVVWVVYLQLLLRNFGRQRRSNILINRAAGSNDRAHVLVSNMGAEPIYVTSMIADLEIDGEVHSAVVTDREEPTTEEEGDALQRTGQGPLNSGQSRDMGSFRDIMARALGYRDLEDRMNDVAKVTVTVAAESGHDAFLAAGQQTFNVSIVDDLHVFIPAATRTRQIRGSADRRRLGERLDRVLRQEAEETQRRAERKEAAAGSRT